MKGSRFRIHSAIFQAKRRNTHLAFGTMTLFVQLAIYTCFLFTGDSCVNVIMFHALMRCH